MSYVKRTHEFYPILFYFILENISVVLSIFYIKHCVLLI